MAIILASTLLAVPSVRAQEASGDGFRPACDLVSAEEVSAIAGTELGPQAVGAQGCIWGGTGPTVVLTLDETGGLEMQGLLFPGASEVMVAGHRGLSISLEDQAFTTLIVALDDGGIAQIQIVADGGLPEDPPGAALAVAEAIFANGPVLARPVSLASGPALGYDGPVCDLVTLAELKEATGRKKFATVEADTPETCSYASNDFSLLVSVGFSEGELFQYQGEGSVDLTVGDRPALWSPQFLDSLVVDIGGGRLLQVALILMEGGPEQLREAAEAIAAIALGRLVPVGPAGPSEPVAAGPGCDIVSVEQVASITGLSFSVGTDEGVEGVGCTYTTADPASEPSIIVISRLDVDDPATAFAALSQVAPGLPAPQDIDVAGNPGFVATSAMAAVAAVDLDAISEQAGRVLAVLWLVPPAGADTTALVVRLAEAAVGNL